MLNHAREMYVRQHSTQEDMSKPIKRKEAGGVESHMIRRPLSRSMETIRLLSNIFDISLHSQVKIEARETLETRCSSISKHAYFA